MGCCSESIRICLLGVWEDKDDWREEIRLHLKQMNETFCMSRKNFNFLETTPPSKVGFFPHNLWDNVTLDIKLAQEQLLAAKADIVVYINDGNWPSYKKAHLNKLEEASGAFILWTPDTLKKQEEFLQEEDKGGMRPGVIAFDGNMRRLASVVLFLALGGEEDLSSATE